MHPDTDPSDHARIGIETDSDRTFVFGVDEAEDCVCPAVAAGREKTTFDGLGYMTKAYDFVARDQYPLLEHKQFGTASETDARDAWLESIERLLANDFDDLFDRPEFEFPEDPEDRDHIARRGVEIAQELGWLEGETEDDDE